MASPLLALLPGGSQVTAVLGAVGLGGETATDRERKAHAAQLETAALSGNRSAVAALEFEAFDKRGQSAADVRTPRDGKYSPAAVRSLASSALQRIVANGVRLTSPERYAQLKVPIPTTQTQDVVRALITPVADRFAPEVGRAAADAARPAINTAVIVGVALVAIAAVAILWSSRG